ncbi:hypothetical protein B5E41_30155 [Rhizobium esperanzae]|uniref:Uncharacterized protein n=1 Tax=Rhizobium esperanzae TaxID=1967781 RepID=A0A246DKS0_9HYPH|nr:hypothetical protein [Rhizobium esperanzae]OWO89705.1 hypothetical protein B5E41_30155 [Rhizobium esperanzae]
MDKIGESAVRLQIAKLLDVFIVHDGDDALELASRLAHGVPDVERYLEARQDIATALLSLKSAKAKLEADQ